MKPQNLSFTRQPHSKSHHQEQNSTTNAASRTTTTTTTTTTTNSGPWSWSGQMAVGIQSMCVSQFFPSFVLSFYLSFFLRLHSTPRKLVENQPQVRSNKTNKNKSNTISILLMYLQLTGLTRCYRVCMYGEKNREQNKKGKDVYMCTGGLVREI